MGAHRQEKFTTYLSMCGQRVLLLVVTLFAVATALPTQSTDSIVPEIDFFNTPEVPPKQDLASVSVKHDVSCAEVPMSALQAAMEAQSVAGLPAACAACLQKSDNDGCGITHESIHEEHDEDDKGDGHDEEGHHDHGPCAPVCGDECQKPEDEFDPTKDCKKCGECYRAHGSGEAVPTFLLHMKIFQQQKHTTAPMHPPMGSGAFPPHHEDVSCAHVPMAT